LGATAFFCKRQLADPSVAARLRQLVKQAAHQSKSCDPYQSVVLVVGSTGAISALETLVRDLQDLTVPIVILQHLPPGGDEALGKLLSVGRKAARIAKDREFLLPGVIIAPTERHLLIDARDRIRLTLDEAVHGHRPSGDVLLKSVGHLGKRVFAIVLSGLGADGARGLAALAANGGMCFAQHPSESPIGSMPEAALAASNKIRPIRIIDFGREVRKAVADNGP